MKNFTQRGVILYLSGENAVKDVEKGLSWYRKAAELGNSRSMAALGYMYQYGIDVDPDPAEAAHWYEQAALAGREDALEALSSLESGKTE